MSTLNKCVAEQKLVAEIYKCKCVFLEVCIDLVFKKETQTALILLCQRRLNNNIPFFELTPASRESCST